MSEPRVKIRILYNLEPSSPVRSLFLSKLDGSLSKESKRFPFRVGLIRETQIQLGTLLHRSFALPFEVRRLSLQGEQIFPFRLGLIRETQI